MKKSSASSVLIMVTGERHNFVSRIRLNHGVHVVDLSFGD